MNITINPKVGQYVFDYVECKKVKVMAIKDCLYFVGKDREPLFRNEFIFPLPSKKQYPCTGNA